MMGTLTRWKVSRVREKVDRDTMTNAERNAYYLGWWDSARYYKNSFPVEGILLLWILALLGFAAAAPNLLNFGSDWIEAWRSQTARLERVWRGE